MAYVDSSVLVAIMLAEDGSASLNDRLDEFDRLVGSNLVEAEVKSARIREEIESDPAFLYRINWIFAGRPLSLGIAKVLGVGYLRGAGLWHVATALYFASEPEDMAFLTLDIRQRNVAEALGFRIT